MEYLNRAMQQCLLSVALDLRRLIIIGAGGHGSVVEDCAQQVAKWGDIFFVDDRQASRVKDYLTERIIGDISSATTLVSHGTDFALGIGDNKRRLEIFQQLDKCGASLPTIIHPRAAVSESAVIGVGSLILAGSVVASRASIGDAVILNHGCTVDHDSHVADAVHISPGAHIAGDVKISVGAWIGIGASVIQNVSIGEFAVVGASAAVISDIASGITVVGVPARQVKKQKR